MMIKKVIMLSTAALIIKLCGISGIVEAGEVIDIRGQTYVTTFAGTGEPDYTGDGNKIPDVTFNWPKDIYFGADENIYIADQFNNAIRKINTNGIISTLSTGYSFTGLVYVSTATLYAASDDPRKILEISLPDGSISVLAGEGSSGDVDGSSTTAKFKRPNKLVYDQTRNCLYISDGNSYKIRKVSLDDGYVTTLAGTGEKGKVDGSSTTAQFWLPWGLAIDSSDSNLYVGDLSAGIRKIDLDTKEVTTFFYEEGYSFGHGIELDDTENYLYFTYNNDLGGDFLETKIYKIEIATKKRYLLAGGPYKVGDAKDGRGDVARFGDWKYGFSINENYVYVAGGHLFYSGNIIHKIINAFAPAPAPAADLTATPLEGAKIRLDWDSSPSSGVTHYKIWYSTEGINHNLPHQDTVSHPADTWTSPALTAGLRYYFAVRAFTAKSEDVQSNIVSAVPEENVADELKARIILPRPGWRIAGNRVLVMADIFRGRISACEFIRFEYKKSTGTAWKTIPSASKNHPNPDYRWPYFIHWDVSELPQTNYDLRAVAYDKDGNYDSSPPFTTVTVDRHMPDMEEKTVGGVHQKRERVHKGRESEVRVASTGDDNQTVIILPADCLDNDEDMIKVRIDPPGIPSVPGRLTGVGVYRQIELESGQESLNGDVIIKIPYKDEILEEMEIPAERLKVCTYRNGRWREKETQIDTDNKLAVAQVNHFSIFGLFGVSAGDLDDMLVYPNPYIPYDGNNDTGKPYTESDAESGIIFDNVTGDVRIRIYTIAGELVRDIYKSGSSGVVRWDIRNDDGNEVASGGYLAVIEGEGDRKVRKIGVIK